MNNLNKNNKIPAKIVISESEMCCTKCNKPLIIKKSETETEYLDVIQIRNGFIESDGNFQPKSDLEILCESCYDKQFLENGIDFKAEFFAITAALKKYMTEETILANGKKAIWNTDVMMCEYLEKLEKRTNLGIWK